MLKKTIGVVVSFAFLSILLSQVLNLRQIDDERPTELIGNKWSIASYVPEKLLSLVSPAFAQGGAPPPIADAGYDRTISAGGHNDLDGTGSTNSANKILEYSWSIVSAPPGSNASLLIPASPRGRLSWDLEGDYVIELIVTEGNKTSAPDYVTLTTVNSEPMADAGRDLKVTVGQTIHLNGDRSFEVDGDLVTYAWTLVSAPAASTSALSDPTAIRPSFVIDQSGDYVFELTVSDGQKTSQPSQVLVSTDNVPPFVRIQVEGGHTLMRPDFTYDGDGDEIDNSWSIVYKPDGSHAKLVHGNAKWPRIQTDLQGHYVVKNEVDDGSETASGNLVVGGGRSQIANAGHDQTIVNGALVQLDGAGSHLGGGNGLLVYEWSLISVPAGSNAVLSDPTSPRPTFTADVDGTYVAQLIVDTAASATKLPSIPDTVVSTTENNPPVADPGQPQLVNKNDTVQLDGTGSFDPDGAPLTYSWSMLKLANSQSNAQITNPTSATPTFVPDKDGIYIIQLIVDDGTFQSDPVNVVIATTEAIEYADAGPDVTAEIGETVQLDGSASTFSTPETIFHEYEWKPIHRPAGSTSSCSGNTATGTIIPDLPGLYVCQLKIEDRVDALDPVHSPAFDTVVVTVEDGPPTADAGPDQSLAVLNIAQLDGSNSSDPEGQTLTYAWTIPSKPAGSTAGLSDPTAENPTLTLDKLGNYVIELIVNDGSQDSEPDSVTVTATNLAPTANAGPDKTSEVGATVNLDGTGSSDPDGHALTYSWTITSKPAGSAATLSTPTSATPSFVADLYGDYTIELVVNDGFAASPVDAVTINATDIPGINDQPMFENLGGSITMSLGQTLTINLSAYDPEGSSIIYTVATLPLPAGATLDGITGVFVFTPNASQVGTHNLTFIATDGSVEATQAFTIEVLGPDPAGITTLIGQVLDADEAAQGNTVPVVGATVSIVGFAGSVTTTSDGSFTLAGLPAGDQTVLVDGSTADPGPSSAQYISYQAPVTLYDKVTITLSDPIELAQLNVASSTPINTGGTTEIFGPSGLRLTIPFEAAKNLDGTLYTGEITITLVPPDQVEGLLPHMYPCHVASIEPRDIYFSSPAELRFGNPDGIVSGEADFWVQNPNTGQFEWAVGGTDSGSGSPYVLPDESFLDLPTLVTHTPRQPIVKISQESSTYRHRPGLLNEGNVGRRVQLPTYYSNGVPRSFSMGFNGRAADPRPIVAADIQFRADDELPNTVESYVEIGGNTVTPHVFTTLGTAANPGDPGLNNAIAEELRQALSVGATTLATGRHDYKYVLTNHYDCSRVGQEVAGSVIARNEEESALGAGWTIPGLDKIESTPDGRVLLVSGDGRIDLLAPDPVDHMVQPAPGHAIDGPAMVALADFNGDGIEDIAGTSRVSGEVVIWLGDGAGGLTEDSRIQAGQTLAQAGQPDVYLIKSADFNEDGIADLVVNNQMSDLVRIYLGNGDATFQTPNDYTIVKPQGLAVIDINNDNNLDIVVPTSASECFFGNCDNHYVYRLLGAGDGTFPNRPRIEFGWDHLGADTADFDNDARLDAVYGSTVTDQVQIAFPNANGSTQYVIVGAGDLPTASTTKQYLAAGDVDGDGNADIVVVNQGDIVRILKGGGDRTFSFWKDISLRGFEPASLALIDLDRDEDLDLVIAGWANGYFNVWLNVGGGGFTDRGNVFQGMGSPLAPNAVIGDIREANLNDDGWPDLIVTDRDANQLYAIVADPTLPGGFQSPLGDFSTMAMNADGTFTRRLTTGEVFTFDAQGRMVSHADVNGNTTLYAYDGNGNLATVTDPQGKVTTYTYVGGRQASVSYPDGRATAYQYDADGNLTQVVHPDNGTEIFGYNGEHLLTTYTNPNGRTTSYNYSSSGALSGITQADGTQITLSVLRDLGIADLEAGFGTEGNPAPYARPEDGETVVSDDAGRPLRLTFDEYGGITSATDVLNRTTTMERDGQGRVIRITKPSDGELPDSSVPGTMVTELDYDERGNVIAKREAVGTALQRETLYEYESVNNRLVKLTEPDNFITTWTHDANGNTLSITDAATETRSFTYDAAGRPLTATDERSNTTSFTYDANGNLETRTDPDLTLTRFTRDLSGRVTQVTAAEGLAEETTVSYVYDDFDRLTSRTDAAGTTLYDYDANGNLTDFTDEENRVLTAGYDDRDRLTSLSDPGFGNQSWTYDNVGNLATWTDARGELTSYVYDQVDRLITTIDPLLQPQAFTYDVGDNLIRVNDAKGNQTHFAYDLLDRSIRRTDPLINTYTATYDARDNVTALIDPKGQNFAWSYDALSRATGVTTPDGPIAFAYDEAGNLTAANDNASNLAFTYDAMDRLATADTLAGGVQPLVTLTSGYDALDRRASLADGAVALAFGHDLVGRMTSANPPTGSPVTLGWQPTGQLTSLTNPNTTSTAHSYGVASGLMTGLQHAQGALAFIDDSYNHDLAGNITQITGIARTRDYVLDELERLTQVTDDLGNESYAYDAEGNRTTSHLSASHMVDVGNRLNQDDAYCYVYDANGNLTTKTEKVETDCTGDVITYGWDSLDRLVSVALPGGSNITYAYDAFGRRIEKNVDGVVTRYVYDGWDISHEYDGTGALLARYGHGPFVDQPLWMERDGNLYFYHADHQGSVLALTDSAGAIVNSYDYDAFGRVLVASEAVENPYLYTGREYDPETGLYHYRARYYDSETGRFLSTDPIGFAGGDSNLYAYVFNNPANLVDPFGLSATGRAGTGAIGATAATGIAAVGKQLSCGFSIIANAFAAINTVISIEDATGGMVDGSIVETADALNPCSRFNPVTMVRKVRPKAVAWTKKQVAQLKRRSSGGKVTNHAELPKPTKGRGAVPPSQRDPKRVLSKKEKGEVLDERGGKCQGCGNKLDVDDARAHHIERHADGGRTTPENTAILCDPCHKKIHR